MIVTAVEFLQLALPFKSKFVHAQKTRSTGDVILVCVTTECGIQGWGEILPRSYVTGESVNSIMGNSEPSLLELTSESGSAPAPSTAPAPAPATHQLAQQLLGCSFGSQAALSAWVTDCLPEHRFKTALFGGVELALWNAMSQTGGIDFNQLLGPVRDRKCGRCVTIGFDATTDSLRARSIDARLKGASVVKLKIGLDDDIERLLALNSFLHGKLPIRVDANGLYDPDRTEALLKASLQAASKVFLQSIEEPFLTDTTAFETSLRTLYRRYQVPFVADETVCSLEDAQKVQAQGCYQLINLRIGKHGGFVATRKIKDLAEHHGIGLVCGSMVGETGVLTQASELLLAHSQQLDYVEGLGQNKNFLYVDPVQRLDESAGVMKPFRFRAQQCVGLLKAKLQFGI